jgi:hypothetical protein
LGITFEQKLRIPESRSIVRRAFVNRIPDSVRLRQTKSGPGEALYRAVARERRRLLDIVRSMRAADYGFVEPKRLADAITRICHGRETHAGQIAPVFALEFWLRSLDAGHQARTAHSRIGDWLPHRQPLQEGASHGEAAV